MKRHPDSICASVTRIDAEVTRQGASLLVRYGVSGNIAALQVPTPAVASRVDRLWQHTCCEVFIQGSGGAYYEINLSPSTQWAVYRFTGYREGMTDVQVNAPIITLSVDTDKIELQARIDCSQLPGLSGNRCRVGVSAVIEDRAGGKSYWALAHAPGKPDFHHADGFVIELEA